ncbi:aerotaxis receptor [Rhodovulum sp. ES.010]|nr:aerotaxis receptor [Rhodovulum sp. ES.010]
MGQPEIQPGSAWAAQRQDEEVHFAPEEIFYSRTDRRGLLRMGNSVFRRVAGYSWDELVGAPHKIVRHPDMPKAAFRIFWKRLLDGYAAGAYVKNRSKDGGYYWVFAVAQPIDGGFLSVRIKPTSPLFETVKTIYAAVRAEETERRLDPDQSAGMLIQHLQKAGFTGYLDFMSQALCQELAARDLAKTGHRAARLDELLGVGQSLKAAAHEQEHLLATLNALQLLPNNIRIVAAQMEKSGGPITAISENYRAASKEILARLDAFAGSRGNLCTQMSRAVAEGAFLMGCAEVQTELARQFGTETASDCPENADEEMALLEKLEGESTARAHGHMEEAVQVADRLAATGRELRRVVLGLDTIKVMGRVECARYGTSGARLAATIEDLDRYHVDIRSRLETLIALSEKICDTAQAFTA